YEAKQVGAPKWNSFWPSASCDVLFAVSWRYLIPSGVYRRAARRAFLFHYSLLPPYRGFSPTLWAILNSEKETGVTLFQMADQVDASPTIAQQRVPIGPDDDVASVMERINEAYLQMLEMSLPALLSGTTCSSPQDESRATYTCRRLPEDNEISWHQ